MKISFSRSGLLLVLFDDYLRKYLQDQLIVLK